MSALSNLNVSLKDIAAPSEDPRNPDLEARIVGRFRIPANYLFHDERPKRRRNGDR